MSLLSALRGYGRDAQVSDIDQAINERQKVKSNKPKYYGDDNSNFPVFVYAEEKRKERQQQLRQQQEQKQQRRQKLQMINAMSRSTYSISNEENSRSSNRSLGSPSSQSMRSLGREKDSIRSNRSTPIRPSSSRTSFEGRPPSRSQSQSLSQSYKKPKSTRTTRSKSMNETGSMKKKVFFGFVQVREYARCLGDHPSASLDGPSMSIDWEYDERPDSSGGRRRIPVDLFEQRRRSRLTFARGNPVPISGIVRATILRHHTQCTIQDIQNNIKQNQKVQRQREASNQRLMTSPVGDLTKLILEKVNPITSKCGAVARTSWWNDLLRPTTAAEANKPSRSPSVTWKE